MKKRLSLSIVFFAVFICSVILAVACSNPEEQPYYGTYEGGPITNETIVINDKNFIWDENSYEYSVSGNTISVKGDWITGDTLDFTIFEDNHVLSVGIIFNFSAGDVPNRNGASSCMLYNFKNNKVTEAYSFSMDGTYNYTNVNDYTLIHAGKYTAKDGVIVMNGTYTVSKKSIKEIWYITESGQIHYGVYVKDLESFISKPSEPEEPNKPEEPGNVEYTLTYAAEEGGRIEGEVLQTVKKGESGSSVIAVADSGYEFVGWSDGVKTAERLDENVTQDITVTAQFEKISEYTLTYTAEEGGRIIGSLTQTVKKGESGSSIIAVADSGYEFIGWSDGVKTAERLDENVTQDIVVTAQFDKIPEYTLTYTAEEGGRIEGEVSQTVIRGGSGTSVIAVAEVGYEFIGWSDGVETAERSDGNVTENISVTAKFQIDMSPKFAGGNGTEEDPYLIATVKHLKNISLYPAAHYRLQNDIILSAVDDGFSNFTPLFDDETMFSGVLDGNGFAIENLTIYNENTFYTGLFSCIGENSWVKNLSLKNVNLSGANYVGGIAGYSLGKITDCSVSGKITYLAENDYKVFLGGIAGRAGNDLNGCSAQVTVTAAEAVGETYAGGIAGYYFYDMSDMKEKPMSVFAEVSIDVSSKNSVCAGGLVGQFDSNGSGATLTNCYATGDVSATSSYSVYAGGLVGQFDGYGATLTNCYATGDVTATSSSSSSYSACAGGLAGWFATSIALTNCYATGDVTATSSSSSSYAYAGGLAGWFYGDSNMLTNCYATGDVSATSSYSVYAGGLVGQFDGYGATLTNCYATGDVTATSSDYSVYAGGLVGQFGSDVTLTNCYTTGDVTATASDAYAGGLAGRGGNITLTNCYTTSRILDSDSENKYFGALVGYAEIIKITNAHWLYFAESGVEYAVGYNESMGIPTSIGSVKHTDIEEFYNLADVLNEGLETPAWEHKTENSLPTLIQKSKEE